MPPNDYEIRVEVSIQNYHQGSGSLRLTENVTIPDCNFEDMADILRGFHHLAEAVKAGRVKAAAKAANPGG